jgi:hypothetical protein
MQSPVQKEILSATRLLLKPLVKFLLRAGIGFREFSQVCKHTFVEVATSEYGIRSRPTNISRVAVMTGLTRKEVKSLREEPSDTEAGNIWLGKLNPPTQILHYWHNDPNFCKQPGEPMPLSVAGKSPSFAELVHSHAGDIPPGAMRVELERADAIKETEDGKIIPTKQHYIPVDLDEKFVDSMFFSLSNLATTIVNNSLYAENDAGLMPRRFERYIWSSKITPLDAEEFEMMTREKGTQFLKELNDWLGEREQLRRDEGFQPATETRNELSYGVGMYSFRSDK